MIILREVSLGYHYFNISRTFRNAMFNSSILTNSEVWFPLKESDLKDIKSADKNLLRKIFGVPVSTPIYLLYLEIGEIPIQYMIKARRINYLHYLLNSPKGEMLRNVFEAQIRNPLKDDWVNIIKKDLEGFNIKYSFDQISKIKETLFKKEAAKACKDYTLRELNFEKEKHEKGENLTYNELKMQSYLSTSKLSANDAKFLFKIRSRMLDVRTNFEGLYKNNLICQVCMSHTDTQELILSCSALGNNNQIKYNDIFSKNLDIVIPILKQFKVLWKKRETILMKKKEQAELAGANSSDKL